MTDAAAWRRCSSCKNPIAFGAQHWVCNVSTCNRPRTGLVFCNVSCWDGHLAVVRHRESWALERRAPSQADWQREQQAAERTPSATGASHAGPTPPSVTASPSERSPRRVLPPPAKREPDPLERDVLVVASKVKSYVRARSGFNTSDRVVEPLSDSIRELCERAIEKARAEGRRTVLDRDFD
jgi:hypothetical protein